MMMMLMTLTGVNVITAAGVDGNPQVGGHGLHADRTVLARSYVTRRRITRKRARGEKNIDILTLTCKILLSYLLVLF